MAPRHVIALQVERAAAAKRLRQSIDKPVRSRRRDLEGPHHRAILHYLQAMLPPEYIIHHTPNRPRSKQSGFQEKANGAIAGWPDLAIYGWGLNGPTAWFLEIKPPVTPGEKTRKPSEDQIKCHARLAKAGFSVRVVRSIDDTRAAVAAWGIPTLDARK